MVTVRVEKERHDAQDVQSTKAVTDAEIDRANTKEALPVVETRLFADMSAVVNAFRDRACVQGELVTLLAKL